MRIVKEALPFASGRFPMEVTEQSVLAALATVVEPDLGRPITELGLVGGVVTSGGRVRMSIALTATTSPHRETLIARATSAVEALGGVDAPVDVTVDVTVMSDSDRARLRQQLIGERPPVEGLRAARVLAVASGKGGVGKSSVAANLAVALAHAGRKVALFDADVWGFSLPRMLGIHRPPLLLDSLLVPVPAHGVAVVSVGLLTEESAPVLWRGPMLHKMLTQFVNDVYWGSPDVVVVDLPPGTGDVSLSLAGLVPDAELLVVTTPQAAAHRVAQRAGYLGRRVGLHVAGVVENMSSFTAPDGTVLELFGAGGGELLARELDVPLLGQLPFDPVVREGGDSGVPVVVGWPESVAAAAFAALAERVLALRPARVRHPDLRVVGTP
jgi:ATP-binding protein involved in chromosome partitioning